MTAHPTNVEEPTPADGRSWHATLLTAAEPGRRNRRTIDAVVVSVAAATTGLAAVIANSAPTVDIEVADAIATILGWAPGFWRAVVIGALAFGLVILAEILLRRRWALARDLLLAGIVLVTMAAVLGRLVDSQWSGIDRHLLSDWGFPELRLACVTAVVTVAPPELVRPARLLGGWLVAPAALGAMVLDLGAPSDVLAGLALGLGAGALVRLALGTAAGVPATSRVQAALEALGVGAGNLTIAARQRIGAAEYTAQDADAQPLKIRVLGRDAQDTQRLARRWRLLAYRDPPRSAPVGRLEQVEHEAVATLLAAQAGVRVPEVVTVGMGADGDAVIVTRQPLVDPLELAAADDVDDGTLERALAAGGVFCTRPGSRTAASTRATCSSTRRGRCWSTCPRRRWGRRNPRSTSTWPSSWSHAPCSSARSARFARPSQPVGATPSPVCFPICNPPR